MAALLALVFPDVRAWLDSNPVEFVSALGAINVLLKFITVGKYEIVDADPSSKTAEKTPEPPVVVSKNNLGDSGKISCLIGALLLPLWLVSCGHDVTLTPEGAEVCKDGACLTVDKDHQTITYRQDAGAPPADDPNGTVVVLPGK